MRTPLEKNLGIQSEANAAETDALLHMALKGKIAGDDYYYNMSPQVFDSCMKGDEVEPYHQLYSRQRTIGMDAFKAEFLAEMAPCSGADLQRIVRCHNYDSGDWLLAQILGHPQCEFATALTVYWAHQPGDVHAGYDDLEQPARHADRYRRASAKLLHQIETRAKSGTFMRTISAPDRVDLNDVLDTKNPDYTKKPFSQVPHELRI